MEHQKIIMYLFLTGLLFGGCEKVKEPEYRIQFPQNTEISEELNVLTTSSNWLVGYSANLSASGDVNARTFGKYASIAADALDTASYYLNIPSERKSLTEKAPNTSGTGDVGIYAFELYLWNAESGEKRIQVIYQISDEGDKYHHEIVSSVNGTDYTKIADGFVSKASPQSGTMQFSFEGKLDNPQYTFEWETNGEGGTSLKVTDHQYNDSVMIISLDKSADDSGKLEAHQQSEMLFTATWISTTLKGNYAIYNNGQIEDQGDWDMLREDLSLVKFSLAYLISDMDTMHALLSQAATTSPVAENLTPRYQFRVRNPVYRYVNAFTPPENAVRSNTPVEGELWSLVYTWSDTAYQISGDLDNYYHNLYVNKDGNWVKYVEAVDSKTDLNATATIYDINDEIPDFTFIHKLSLKKVGSENYLDMHMPEAGATTYGRQIDFYYDPLNYSCSDFDVDWYTFANPSELDWYTASWTAYVKSGSFSILYVNPDPSGSW